MAITQPDLIKFGTLMIFLGIIIIFAGMFFANSENSRSNVKFSVVGMFGFIPFGFGNDKKLFTITLGISVLLMILYVVFFLQQK
ncbi:DUF131 domain-containing protein [Candidatus Woesearchaeota archaeon]|nr:DUF131 domain-containing protein [Candidatus Woesearchaeota archaeon]